MTQPEGECNLVFGITGSGEEGDHTMRERTLFVLGAGFSRYAEFPLVRDLHEEVVTLLRTHEQWRHDKLQRCLDRVLVSVPAGFEEALQVIIRRRLDSVARGETGHPWVEVDDALRQATARVLWQRHEQLQVVPAPYLNFARRLFDTGSTVISFNWDVLVEKAVSGVAASAWGYRSDARVRVLKPHGSINWSYFPLAGSSADPGIWLEVENTGFRYPVEDPLVDFDPPNVGPGHTRHMIFPGDIEPLPVLLNDIRAIWRECEEEGARADRVVLLGYSLPPYDKQALSFLRAACSGKAVEVVNPSASDRRRIEAALEVQVHEQACGFERSSYARPIDDGTAAGRSATQAGASGWRWE